MKELTTAIWGKLSGSTLAGYISNRLFKGRAPDDADYPYAVYMVVTNTPERTFTEDFENTTIQFSLFSISSGTTEIENMYSALKGLYDEQPLTITGSTLVWMRRDNAVFSVEDHAVVGGTQRVWAYHVDFSVKESLD